MLNSSNFEQLASEGGMADKRLYLISNRLRFFRLPIESGKSINSLWVKSNVVSWAQLPKHGRDEMINLSLLENLSRAYRSRWEDVRDGCGPHPRSIVGVDDRQWSVKIECDSPVNSTFANSRRRTKVFVVRWSRKRTTRLRIVSETSLMRLKRRYNVVRLVIR